MLSSDEVVSLAGPNTRFICYSDLKKYKRLEDVFGNNTGVILLYRFSPNVGHYVGLIKHSPHLYEWFDPYGSYPDSYLKLPNFHKKELGQDRPLLSHLILNFLERDKRNRFAYNEFKYQSLHDPNSTTCGYHVATRLAHRDLTLDEYQRFFNQLKQQTDPDIYVQQNAK